MQTKMNHCRINPEQGHHDGQAFTLSTDNEAGDPGPKQMVQEAQGAAGGDEERGEAGSSIGLADEGNADGDAEGTEEAAAEEAEDKEDEEAEAVGRTVCSMSRRDRPSTMDAAEGVTFPPCTAPFSEHAMIDSDEGRDSCACVPGTSTP